MEYVKENVDINELRENRDDVQERLCDELFVEDSVTGNASGSYTFNSWVAEENLCHNMDLLEEAIESFGDRGVNPLEKGAECCDVTIRCYLLAEVLNDVLDDFEDANPDDETEESEACGEE